MKGFEMSKSSIHDTFLRSVVAIWCSLMVEATTFKSIPTTVKTYENDTVLLPCYLDETITNYRIKWWRNDELIGDSADPGFRGPERIRMWANSSLQVTRLQPTDTADYLCEVIRPEPWSSIRQVHAIEVQYPPKITTVPESGYLEVRKGHEVDISCHASGTPRPIVDWIGQGKPMELLDHRVRLKFNATSREFRGVYECVANNGVGVPAKAAIQLVILDAPVVSAPHQRIHTALGMRAQLEGKVDYGIPQARVHWFKGSQPIDHYNSRIIRHNMEEDNKYMLVIKNVRSSDFGKYTFRAENALGMADVHIVLTGEPNKAKFKVESTRNNATVTSFTLLWEVDSYSPIIEYNLWFRLYKLRDENVRRKADDTWTKLTIPGQQTEGPLHAVSYTLRGLKPNTVYEAIVTSRNRFGWSIESTELRFSTEKGIGETVSTLEYTHSTPQLVLEDVSEEIVTEKSRKSEKSYENAYDTDDTSDCIRNTSNIMLLVYLYVVTLLIYNFR